MLRLVSRAHATNKLLLPVVCASFGLVVDDLRDCLPFSFSFFFFFGGELFILFIPDASDFDNTHFGDISWSDKPGVLMHTFQERVKSALAPLQQLPKDAAFKTLSWHNVPSLILSVM